VLVLQITFMDIVAVSEFRVTETMSKKDLVRFKLLPHHPCYPPTRNMYGDLKHTGSFDPTPDKSPLDLLVRQEASMF